MICNSIKYIILNKMARQSNNCGAQVANNYVYYQNIIYIFFS